MINNFWIFASGGMEKASSREIYTENRKYQVPSIKLHVHVVVCGSNICVQVQSHSHT